MCASQLPHYKIGEKMLIKNPEFKISAVSPKQYPNDGLP